MQPGTLFALLCLVVTLGLTLFIGTYDSAVTYSTYTVYKTTVETVQVDGTDYTISGPYSHGNLTAFLVHGDGNTLLNTKVMTLGEALEQRKARVYETDAVEELAIENLTDDTDIYVQCGDILQGGKQDRVIASDLLVAAASRRVPLPTFCVEQGRWGERPEETGRGLALMNPGQTRANPVADAFSGGSVSLFSWSRNSVSSRELKNAVLLDHDQEQVWREVNRTQVILSSKIGADAISDASSSSLELTLGSEKVQSAIAEFKKSLGSLLDDKEKVRGYVFAINSRIDSAEVYASDALVRRMWLKMLQASAVEALAKADETCEESPVTEEDVHRFLTIAKNTAASGREFDARVLQVTAECDGKVFSESRGGASSSEWIHRSYIAR